MLKRKRTSRIATIKLHMISLSSNECENAYKKFKYFWSLRLLSRRLNSRRHNQLKHFHFSESAKTNWKKAHLNKCIVNSNWFLFSLLPFSLSLCLCTSPSKMEHSAAQEITLNQVGTGSGQRLDTNYMHHMSQVIRNVPKNQK